jgi:hypothetical protein
MHFRPLSDGSLKDPQVPDEQMSHSVSARKEFTKRH